MTQANWTEAQLAERLRRMGRSVVVSTKKGVQSVQVVKMRTSIYKSKAAQGMA